MNRMKIRMATTTALVTSLFVLYNLPVQASGELLEDGQNVQRTAVQTVDEVINEFELMETPAGTRTNQHEDSLNLAKVTVRAPSSPHAFIKVDERGHKTASPLFVDMQETLLRMGDLSYNLAKDGAGHLHLNTVEMARLKSEGWEFKGFYGLEGRRNTYGDLSGLVFYHPIKNVITVVYHGTAGNKDGWGTNFDGQKIKPSKINQEFCKDLFDEVLEEIKDAKLQLSTLGFKKLLKDSIKDETLSLNQARDVYEELKLLISDKKIDAKLGRKLDDIFHDKITLMVDAQEACANLQGEMHKGFLKKYLSTKHEMLNLVKHYMKKDTKVILTGHSQAGGVAEIAMVDLAANNGKELYGADFDNKKSGKISGYFLSAARAGDKDFKKWTHNEVGQDQIARQNVNGDPVPIASGDAQFAELIKELIPAVGEAIQGLLGYDDAGHLLLDAGHETYQRAKEHYGKNKFDLSRFDKVDDAIQYLASYIVDQAPEFLVGENSKPVGFFTSPLKWIKQRWSVASMVKLIYNAKNGDPKAKEALKEVLTKRFAHLHYAIDRGEVKGTKIGAVFTPEIVGKDLNKMLKHGAEHEQKRSDVKAAKKAERRAIIEAN
jgi:hypothetical protein